MTLCTPLVRAICRLLLAVMLLTQWAVSAHACEGPFAMQSAQAAAQDATDMPPDCEMLMGKDGGKDALCLEHCRFGQQSSDTASVPSVFVALPVLLYRLPEVALTDTVQSERSVEWLVHAGAPPPPSHAILHCVWRI